MSLTAYALALVNSKEKINANDRLVQRAIYDNGKTVVYEEILLISGLSFTLMA